MSIDASGGLAGVTLGYNWQTGSWVWGLEGDLDWADIKGDTTCGAGTCEIKDEWLGTARARIGKKCGPFDNSSSVRVRASP